MHDVHGFRAPEVALLLTLGSMWGFSFFFVELALEGLRPLWIVAGRTLIGALILYVVLRLRGGGLPRSAGTWRHLIVLGALNNAFPWGAVSWAQQSLPSGVAALLMALVPMTTLVLAVAAGHERFTVTRLLGLLLALGGVALMVVTDLGDPGRVVGIGVVVLATLSLAGGAVYGKVHLSGRTPPLVIATGQIASGFLLILPVALVLDGVPGGDALTLAVLAPVAALGAFGTGLAFLVFYTLMSRVGATNTTLVNYLVPFVGVTAGTLLLDERLRVAALVGGVLIVLGIWLAQRNTASPQTRPQASTGRVSGPPASESAG